MELASSVLEWACDPAGPPPRGALLDLEKLAQPDVRARRALTQLIALTAARLGLGAPPRGDARPPGPGAVWLAAAVGASALPESQALARLAVHDESAGSVSDQLARHGLIDAALLHVEGGLADGLREASPLTALLRWPAPGCEDAALTAAERWLDHPEGRRLLVGALAAPSGEPAALTWRRTMLEQWRLEGAAGRALVLEVYEHAVHHHGADWARAATAAQRVLADPRVDLTLTLARCRFWTPFRRVHRAFRDEVRAHAHLSLDDYHDWRVLSDLAEQPEMAWPAPASA